MIYGAVAAARMRQRGRRAGVPVICLGNLTVGGAGKTPAALTVAQILHAAHERPFFLVARLWRPARRTAARQSCVASRRPMSATSRSCWRGSRPPSWRAIASPARNSRNMPARASSSWTTACRIRRSVKDLSHRRRRRPPRHRQRPRSFRQARCGRRCRAQLDRAQALIVVGPDERCSRHRQTRRAKRPEDLSRAARARPRHHRRDRQAQSAGLCRHRQSGQILRHLDRGRRDGGRTDRL